MNYKLKMTWPIRLSSIDYRSYAIIPGFVFGVIATSGSVPTFALRPEDLGKDMNQENDLHLLVECIRCNATY